MHKRGFISNSWAFLCIMSSANSLKRDSACNKTCDVTVLQNNDYESNVNS